MKRTQSNKITFWLGLCWEWIFDLLFYSKCT